MHHLQHLFPPPGVPGPRPPRFQVQPWLYLHHNCHERVGGGNYKIFFPLAAARVPGRFPLRLITQFFRPFRPTRRGRRRLRSGRPARDQYKSGCPGRPYPAVVIVVFGLRLASTILVFVCSTAARCRRVRCPVVFARRRLCKKHVGKKTVSYRVIIIANGITVNKFFLFDFFAQ